MYLLTLISPMSRGAPHSELSRPNPRIRARTTAGLPGFPRRVFHVQNRRKPFRCQAISVCGLAMNNRQSVQISNSRLGRLTERCRTPSWCRSARLFKWSAARHLKLPKGQRPTREVS